MIGIYDSGSGGISIFNTIKQVLPNESISYFADTRYFPFGSRSTTELRRIVLDSLKKLAEQCNVLVIACNTASVNNLDVYRTVIHKPVIGVVPVIKTAAALTKNGKIALLATTVTTESEYTDTLIRKFANHATVHKIACPGLADAIEHNTLTDELLKTYLAPIGEADIVILGSTHYTLIKGKIQRLVGPDVKVIDSNEAVARQTLRVLQKNNLMTNTMNPTYSFECSGDRAAFLEQIKRYAHL